MAFLDKFKNMCTIILIVLIIIIVVGIISTAVSKSSFKNTTENTKDHFTLEHLTGMTGGPSNQMNPINGLNQMNQNPFNELNVSAGATGDKSGMVDNATYAPYFDAPRLSNMDNLPLPLSVYQSVNAEGSPDMTGQSTYMPRNQQMPQASHERRQVLDNPGYDNNIPTLEQAFAKLTDVPTNDGSVDMQKYNQEKYNIQDYLPKEINNDWFETDFSQARQKIENGNLINVDQFIYGLDTVGQSKKNATHDLRGDIPIAKMEVGPFNNSSIEEPDLNIKRLC